MERREFFRKGLPGYLVRLGGSFLQDAGFGEEKKSDYFDSFESAYPFLSEVSMDMLYQAAEQLHIDPTGKCKLELAREVYEKRGMIYHDG